jgi:hypothetical protein
MPTKANRRAGDAAAGNLRASTAGTFSQIATAEQAAPQLRAGQVSEGSENSRVVLNGVFGIFQKRHALLRDRRGIASSPLDLIAERSR